jgi:hypothetical protein
MPLIGLQAISIATIFAKTNDWNDDLWASCISPYFKVCFAAFGVKQQSAH